jgi:peptide/nickel transport system permease protein
MWLMDVILAFPQIVLAIVFVSMLGPLPWLIVLVVALTHIPRVARLTRSLTAECVQQEYIEAAEAIATPKSRILVREVLPNLATPLAVETTIRLAWSIAIIAALSFVGFGVQPPSPDWGLMINENRTGLVVQPWSVLAPAFLVAMLAVGVSLIGDGLARAVAGVDERVGQ